MADQGNPRKPEGEAGEEMLHRMNRSHYEMTGWGLKAIDFQKKDRVLDIGCGGGMTLKRIGELVTEGHLTGVDYSEVSIQESEKLNAKAVQQGRMDFVEGSVEKLPFSDETFDKIVTVESFYFWPDPPENLKEAYRVLKKGGQMLLVSEVYNGDRLSAQDKENISTYNLFNPTLDEFNRYFLDAGFCEVALHTRNDISWLYITALK